MAIDNPNEQQQQNPAVSSASQAFTPVTQSAASSSNPFGNFTLSTRNSQLAFAPIRNQMGAEEYEKLGKAFREIAKEESLEKRAETTVIALDRAFDAGLHYDGFIVAVQSNSNKEIGVGFNIILLEGTGEPLPSVKQTFQNETVDTPRHAEVCVDQKLIQIAQNALVAKFGRQVPLYMSDTQTVPAGFDPEDNVAVRKLLANAAAAALTSLVMFSEQGKHFQSDVNLVRDVQEDKKKYQQGDADLTFIHDFTPSQEVDYLGRRTRSSVAVKAMMGYRKNQQNASFNDGSGPRQIAEVLGYVDLMPLSVNRQMQQQQQFMPNGQPVVQNRLQPVYVITRPSTNFALTPGSMNLALLIAADLNKYGGWANAFIPKKGIGGKNDIDLTDIGGISIDIPNPMDPNQPIPRPDTKSHGFTTESTMQFLGSYANNNLQLAIDVPRAGATTWHQSIFLQAARGVAGAVDRLNKSMNDLTNGAFLKLLPSGVSPVATQTLEIETGYWEDGKIRRDIADVDYVAVCNYADHNNNPAMVERWTNSFLQFNRPEPLRLADRRAIIQEVTGHQAVFTGRSTRVFINGAWLKVALDALTQAGVTTSSEGGNNAILGGQRADASFLRGFELGQGAGWTTASQGNSGFVYGGGVSQWGNGGTL